MACNSAVSPSHLKLFIYQGVQPNQSLGLDRVPPAGFCEADLSHKKPWGYSFSARGLQTNSGACDQGDIGKQQPYLASAFGASRAGRALQILAHARQRSSHVQQDSCTRLFDRASARLPLVMPSWRLYKSTQG